MNASRNLIRHGTIDVIRVMLQSCCSARLYFTQSLSSIILQGDVYDKAEDDRMRWWQL